MTFRLIRTTGIELTDAVNAAVASMGSDDSRSSTEMAMGAVGAYIAAASEAPTDAELDELCRAMWGDMVHWWGDDVAIRKGYVTSTGVQWMEIARDKDRTSMKRFLAALGDKHE